MNKGSIYYSENEKRWRSEISLGIINGKKQVKKFSAKSKTELQQKIRTFKKEYELKDSNAVFGNSVTVGQFADYYLNNIAPAFLKSKFLEADIYILNRFILPVFQDHYISQLSYNDIQNFLNNLFYDGVSHRNIVKSYQFINKIIKQFVIHYQIQINPCYGITIPQNNTPSELKFYNKEQIEKIENEAI